MIVDLSPDESDEEQDESHQEDYEDSHVIRVVKVSKDKVEVDGVLSLEEARSVAGEVVGLALGPDPDVVLEGDLEVRDMEWTESKKCDTYRYSTAVPFLGGGVEVITS